MKRERTKKDHIRADLLLIGTLLLFALVLFLWQQMSRESGAVAAVYVNGVKTAEYPLSVDTTVTLKSENGGYNVLVVSDGCADVTDASCPDGICVRTRAVRYAGESIICLPNKTEIRIEGAPFSGVDLVLI